MALTRQTYRQLAYLLEVAPIGSSPAGTQRRTGLCAQFALKRRTPDARCFQTATVQRKAKTKHGANAKARSSATSALVSDAEARRPRGTTTATSTATATAPATPASNPASTTTTMPPTANATGDASADVALERLTQVLADARKPLQIERVVAETEALTSLRLCHDLAKAFKDGRHSNNAANSPAINLLFLELDGDADAVDNASRLERAAGIKEQALRKIAGTARAIMLDPKVFITPKILEAYVDLRSFIEHPEDLAEIFQVYANKLVPEPNSSPVKYSDPSPDKASFAIPLQTAQKALDAAIETKNLPLCLDIITESVAKKAFKRHKLIQKALLPAVGVGMAPIAAYALASQFAVFQENMYTDTARWVGFAGIMSYFAFTGTIGIVALTTANDQMERVVWQDGTPLRERWLREEERSMLDQVAVAWGFKDPYRKGEEEGPDWEALRELISLRGMILDKIELMEGMQ